MTPQNLRWAVSIAFGLLGLACKLHKLLAYHSSLSAVGCVDLCRSVYTELASVLVLAFAAKMLARHRAIGFVLSLMLAALMAAEHYFYVQTGAWLRWQVVAFAISSFLSSSYVSSLLSAEISEAPIICSALLSVPFALLAPRLFFKRNNFDFLRV